MFINGRYVSESPDYYVFDADVYCEACTQAIKERLETEGSRPDNPDDECSYDSSEWPKGPYSGEESDSPQHCGSGPHCLDPLILNGEKYGKFLENDLTDDGRDYVVDSWREEPTDVATFWMEFYGLYQVNPDDPRY